MASPGKTVLACALLAAALFAGCSKKEQGTEEEPAREGLALDLAGVEYNVFITRELNPQIPPDNAYYKGPLAKRGEALYGVFLEACNNSQESLPTASSFKIIDNQGNEFEPAELPEENDFAYHPTELGPDQCQPEAGSVAQLGPTAGSMLLFRLPISNTDNRPLELEVQAPPAAPDPEEKLIFELDI